jgi:hypothetical protein
MMHRLVLVLALCATAVVAQTNRGSLSGTVSDQTQAVMPGITVTITNLGTNEVRKVTTSANGSYSATNLEPVSYRVEAESQGFKKSVVDNAKVDTATNTTVNLVLQTGSVDTQVTVRAESTSVNTESGSLSNTVTEREIQDVPLLNRSVLDLALTLPNVSGDAGTENPALVGVTTCPGCNLSVGGGRPMSTLMMADGTNNTGVSLARTMVSFSPETVQEFTVLSSAFSAEYGDTGGGVIIVTTKSGTNEFNGTALWFNRNPEFAAAPFTLATTNRSKPTLKYNQFSLAAGGPVYIPKVYNGKNKTFWFAAYEPFYRRDHLDQYGLLPTDAMRTGDFSGMTNTTVSGWLPNSVVQQFTGIAPASALASVDSAIYQQYNVNNGQFTPITLCTATVTTNCQAAFLPFPGNKIPSNMLDATALKSLKYIAPAGAYYLNANNGISNIYSPRLLSQDEKRYTVRVDHAISANNRLYVRYTATPIVKIQGTPVSPTNNSASYSWAKQAMLADTHTFTPRLLNDIRLNYTRGRFSSTVDPQWDPYTGANLGAELGLPNITKGGVPTFSGLFPGSSPGGGGSTATGFGGAGSTNAEDREERYAFTDIVYMTRGAMSLKFGVDASHALQNILPLYGAFGGIYAFSNLQSNSTGTSAGTGGSPWASFMQGVVNGNVTMRNTQVPYYYRWEQGAAFIQNDWKVRSNLSINIGLRYNLSMPRTEKYNNQGVFRPDLAQSVQLATPLTLTNGQVVTSATVPAFAFSGIGGNSRYLTKAQYGDFEPRFSFAWQPDFLRDRHLVARGGYGLSHAPIGGFTQLPQPDFGANAAYASTVPSSTANPTNVLRLGENPPLLNPVAPSQSVYGPGGPPANGLVYLNSLYYQASIGGFAVSQNYHTPYVNNWNFTISWQAGSNTTMDFAYSGAMGIHLFMGQEGINPKNSSLLTAQLAANINTTATIADPLGRKSPITGAALTVQNGSLGSPYLGFSSLYQWFDAAGNSIRHAGYFNVTHRAARGLNFTANYTYGKSIDTASGAGGDKGIVTPVGGAVAGQVVFGGTRGNDRSVSTFDQRHVIHGAVIYDLPFGQGRQLLNKTWKPLDFLVGGWTISSLVRDGSGFPYVAYLSDTNQIGDYTHAVRPDMNPYEPLLNPLYSRNCPTGSGCQPYLNPGAFLRPVLGTLGNAPRTMDNVRGPWQRFIDANIEKNFRLGEKRRVQFRLDALNVFNHPTFAVYPNNAGGADFMGAPSTATLTTAAYNTWATANSQPPYNTAAGAAIYNNIVSMVNAQKTAAGALPADFFHVSLGQNFYGKAATSYDITTLNGYKLYQLRTAYATNFGTLYNNGTPRYIQFGLKLYF